MKQILLSSLLLFVIGCQSSEKTEQEIKEAYIAKGQKYFDAKVLEEDNGENVLEQINIENIDSIIPLSTYDIERIKMMPLLKGYTKQVKFATKLSEIDLMIDDTYTPATMLEIEKAGVLKDSLETWQLKSESLTKKDTLSYQVFFKTVITQTDGSKLKNTIPIVFDKAGDIDGYLMNLIFP